MMVCTSMNSNDNDEIDRNEIDNNDNGDDKNNMRAMNNKITNKLEHIRIAGNCEQQL